MPVFSIITICYNEEKLEDTCKTIAGQTFQDFEWIVIDGGSKKEYLDIFEKYQARINYFVSEKDSGRYNAMNKGIKQANGEYLLFMNAGDCFYDCTILEKVYEKIKDKKQTDVFYGNGYMHVDDKLYLYKKPAKLTIEFLYKSALFHQAMFIKKELFNKFGTYDEKYKIVADWKHYMQLLLNNCSFEYIDINIAVDDGNGISNTQMELAEKERKEVLSEIFTEEELAEVRKKYFNQFETKKQIQDLISGKIKALKAAKEK